MRLGTRALLGVGLGLTLTVSAAAQPAPPWARLTADQQTALRPLQQRWDKLPDFQRVRLLRTAKRYVTMSPEQQRRYSKRLVIWANLSLEQRNRVRAAYLEYSRQPKADQLRLRKRWYEQHPENQLATEEAGLQQPDSTANRPPSPTQEESGLPQAPEEEN